MKTTKESNSKNKILNTNKGITLIALMITIILMLILATITVNVVIDGGLFNYAKDAKDNTEIASEKQTIKISSIQAIQMDKHGNLKVEDLEKNLKKQIQNEDIEVAEGGDKIYVEFKESGRIYEVDEDGNAEIYIPYKDETPGEVAQDENGNFMIESIEDLVTFSAMVNGGYKDDNINITSNQFADQTVLLMTNLDFKSKWSYEDSSTTIYNGYLGIEDTTVPLIEALTDTELYKGFIPIGNTGSFAGTFDGNNYSIQNLSENLDTYAGLFGKVSNSTIKNLTITGNIKTTGAAGGFVGYTIKCFIENCKNEVQVFSGESGGGFVGTTSVDAVTISNCCNEGKIEGNQYAGGFFGSVTAGTVINSYNKGEIISARHAGGIVGYVYSGIEVEILNCYNAKEATVTGDSTAGGIAGYLNSTCPIINCYNLGRIKGTSAGGILGYEFHAVTCRNCYSTGKISGTYVGGIIGRANWNNPACIFKNCYYLESETVTDGTGAAFLTVVDATGLTSLTQETINVFNTYIETDPDIIDTTDWLKWQIDKNGNPSFTE